jgi:hypothetical protein
VDTTASVVVASTAPVNETINTGVCGHRCDQVGAQFDTPNVSPPTGLQFLCVVTVTGPIAPMTLALPATNVDIACGDGATLTSGGLTIESVDANDFRASFSMTVTARDGTIVELSNGHVSITGCHDQAEQCGSGAV